MSNCKKCQSCAVTKNGFVRAKQRYRCKTCGYNFVIGDGRINSQTAVKRAFAVILYSHGKRLMGSLPSCLMYHQARFRNSLGLQAKQRCCLNLRFQSTLMNWNLMRCGISSGQKKTSEEFSPPFIVEQGTPLPGVIGGRDADTFRRLFDKVRHLSDCQYHTDNWEAFAKVLPVEHHHVGNAGTATVERNNSYTRHHLG